MDSETAKLSDQVLKDLAYAREQLKKAQDEFDISASLYAQRLIRYWYSRIQYLTGYYDAVLVFE